jgi:hypothetical protein
MIDEIALESLQNDFETVKEYLQVISERVVNEGISEYPIFVASREWVEMGKPIFSREDMQLNWYFYASLLEEFIKKDIIKRDKVTAFKKAYPDSDEKACIFVVVGNEAKFAFIPYESEEEDEE